MYGLHSGQHIANARQEALSSPVVSRFSRFTPARVTHYNLAIVNRMLRHAKSARMLAARREMDRICPLPQGGGDALYHLGEDGLRRGEVEPEGARPARAEGRAVDDGDVRTLDDQLAG